MFCMRNSASGHEVFQDRANRMSPRMNKGKCTVRVAFVISVFKQQAKNNNNNKQFEFM